MFSWDKMCAVYCAGGAKLVFASLALHIIPFQDESDDTLTPSLLSELALPGLRSGRHFSQARSSGSGPVLDKEWGHSPNLQPQQVFQADLCKDADSTSTLCQTNEAGFSTQCGITSPRSRCTSALSVSVSATACLSATSRAATRDATSRGWRPRAAPSAE